MTSGFLENLLGGLNLGALGEIGDIASELGSIDLNELSESVSGISDTLANLESSVLVYAALLKTILFVIIGLAAAKLIVLVIVFIKQCMLNRKMKAIDEKVDRMLSQQIVLNDSDISEGTK